MVREEGAYMVDISDMGFLKEKEVGGAEDLFDVVFDFSETIVQRIGVLDSPAVDVPGGDCRIWGDIAATIHVTVARAVAEYGRILVAR